MCDHYTSTRVRRANVTVRKADTAQGTGKDPNQEMARSKAQIWNKWNLGPLGQRSVSAIPTILVAHHDEYARDLIEKTLDGEGFSVASAGDGIEALAAVRSQPPDLLVIANNLRGLDGPTVIKAMAQVQARDRTKVILLGGVREELEPAVQALVQAVVASPFRPIGLLVAATELLSARPVSDLARDSRAHLRVVN